MLHLTGLFHTSKYFDPLNSTKANPLDFLVILSVSKRKDVGSSLVISKYGNNASNLTSVDKECPKILFGSVESQVT